MSALTPEARDRLYAGCARAISDAGIERESLFLARLALLLFVLMMPREDDRFSVDQLIKKLRKISADSRKV